AELELRQAIHCKSIYCPGRFIRRPRNVRRRRTVLDPVAVARKGIRAGAVDSLSIVLLKTGEVTISHGDQLLPRHALCRRDGLEPEFLSLVRLVHIGNIVRAASARPEEDAFDFRYAAKLDTQP